MEQIKTVQNLKSYYKKLPGIGEKTAERLAYATLSFDKEVLIEFSNALQNVVNNITTCPHCGIFIDSDKCPICDDESRDKKTLLVVSDVKNVISFEKTNKYHGLYFVLGGSISLMKGITPEKLHIPELKKRVIDDKINEVILACNSTLEGETTSLYIAKILEETNVKVSRLAFGLPFGAELEYVDEATISRSLLDRTVVKGENNDGSSR